MTAASSSAATSRKESFSAILITLGTKGDLIPFLIIAEELTRRGIAASIISNADHRTLVEDSGLEFVAVGPAENPDAALDPEGFFYRETVPSFYKIAEAVERIALARDSIVVITRVGNWGAALACERYQVPMISVHLQPATIWESDVQITGKSLQTLNTLRTHTD